MSAFEEKAVYPFMWKPAIQGWKTVIQITRVLLDSALKAQTGPPPACGVLILSVKPFPLILGLSAVFKVVKMLTLF